MTSPPSGPPTPLHHSPACERNGPVIAELLQRILPARGEALEIASGTGQHAAQFGCALPGWRWQPSDRSGEAFASIAGWAAQRGVTNVLPARRLDVLDDAWPSDGPPFEVRFDLIFCANMLHISPWASCGALMRGAARHLAPGGLLVTYGPYVEATVPTAPSNLAFDADLRARNPAWGIRLLSDVDQAAQAAGLQRTQRHALPANNLLLVFAARPG